MIGRFGGSLCEFIALLGGGAAAWPLAARAQQAIPLIGFIYTDQTSSEAAPFVAAFHQGLREAGFIEGQNVAVEYRWAGRQYDRLPAFATEMVHRRVAVIIGNSPPAMAAKTATSTIPIVFFLLGHRPGKNRPCRQLQPPRWQCHRREHLECCIGGKAIGATARTASTSDRDSRVGRPELSEPPRVNWRTCKTPRALGKQIQVLRASTESELDNGFASLAQQRPDALIVAAAPFFTARRKQLVTLADQHRIAAIYSWREFPAAGGLISYGASFTDAFRQVGVYTGRILKGEKPADLPVLQPTKY